MQKFTLEGDYRGLLQQYGFDVRAVLRKARLPEDILSHKTLVMQEEEYYRFLCAIDHLADDPELPVRMATGVQIEVFSPPLFAAYCSRDGAMCLKRLARYKKLIGPMQFILSGERGETTVILRPGKDGLALPSFLVQSEFAFLIGLLRRAAQEDIRPRRIMVTELPKCLALETLAGCAVEQGAVNAIAFADDDLAEPFISCNEALWSYFEPELARRLADLSVDESTAARVRSALTELLPGGASGIEAVAEALGMGRRTLQRKLSEEGTTYQKQLNSTREVLALHYVGHTDMTTNDIAYLLGYAEINSFLRAFKIWTGRSVSACRCEHQSSGNK